VLNYKVTEFNKDLFKMDLNGAIKPVTLGLLLDHFTELQSTIAELESNKIFVPVVISQT
jgi:hypothetical protein